MTDDARATIGRFRMENLSTSTTRGTVVLEDGGTVIHVCDGLDRGTPTASVQLSPGAVQEMWRMECESAGTVRTLSHTDTTPDILLTRGYTVAVPAPVPPRTRRR